MAVVDIELVKQAVNWDDFNGDELWLGQCLDAAVESVVMMTNRELGELIEMGGGELPATLKSAVVMLAAHQYQQRVAVDSGGRAEVPYTLSALVRPWRRLV